MAEALGLILSFSAYLRPGELITLRVMDLVPPPQYESAGKQWSLVIRPEQVGRSTKTGTFDDSVILDSPYTAELGPMWAALVGCEPGSPWRVSSAPLFPFTQDQYSKSVKQAFTAVGGEALAAVAYSARHGGPAWDRYKKFRSVPEVKSRGRWLSDRSLRRYEKHSKLAQVMGMIAKPWQRYHALCAKQLVKFLMHPSSAPAGP